MKVPIEDVIRFEEQLDLELVAGDITHAEYDDRWHELLAAMGWTEDEYHDEIDRRWDWLERDDMRWPGDRDYGAD